MSKTQKGRVLFWKRRNYKKGNNGQGAQDAYSSDLQVTFSFTFISSPQTCEADSLYFTDEEMGTQRVNLLGIVMVETACLKPEIYN